MFSFELHRRSGGRQGRREDTRLQMEEVKPEKLCVLVEFVELGIGPRTSESWPSALAMASGRSWD